MQIREIVLYSFDGERRILPLTIGAVNIVTGSSKTGKSSIIDIIEYCLGRRSFGIPAGVIRSKVAWYALKLQLTGYQIFVARPSPTPGRQTTSSAYIEISDEIPTPSFSSLRTNIDIDGLVLSLTNRIGILPNAHRTPEGQTRQDLEATLLHALFFVFQSQDEIASRRMLFHRQNEQFIPQAIRDVLPYFLGAYQEDRLALERQLRIESRRLAILERRLAEAQEVAGRGGIRALELLLEARQAGLAPDGLSPDDTNVTLELLRPLLSWTPSDVSFPTSDQMLILQRRREQLFRAFTEKTEEVVSAREFMASTEDYASEGSEQVARLASIHAYESNDFDGSRCPLCSSELAAPIPSVLELTQALEDVRLRVSSTTQEIPRVNELLDRLERELEDIRSQIQVTERAIAALLGEEEAARQLQDRNSRQARMVGRISLFLQSSTESEDFSELQQEIDAIRSEIESLRTELSDDLANQRLVTALSRMSAQMTQWADQLRLEHSNNPVFLDLSRLTIGVDRGDMLIRLDQMGAGENWVAYHLIAHLALHYWFIQNDRPVPRFLVLDQPTQVYYPPEVIDIEAGSDSIIEDADRQAVFRMFDLIFNVASQLNGQFQVLILDHADLDDERFRDAVVERWRGGLALVPDDWPSPPIVG